MRRIPSLDGIRAIAALLVVVGHLHGFATSILMGVFGVHVFYVLSGYLITTLLQNESERGGRIDLVAFYRRRCFRIFPAAYTYILVVALLGSQHLGLLYALTYTVSYHIGPIANDFGHLWSLSVEEQFYLLWPLALVLGFRYRAAVAWSAMLAAAAFRLALSLHPSAHSLNWINWLHFSFPSTMDSIAAGCLLAIYGPKLHGLLAERETSAAAVIVVPAAWVAFLLCWGASPLGNVLWGIVPLLIALSVFLLVKHKYRFINNPLAYSLGALSYSLYLWQQPFTIESHYPKELSVFMLLACALASYFVVEKPMLRLSAQMSADPLRVNARRWPAKYGARFTSSR